MKLNMKENFKTRLLPREKQIASFPGEKQISNLKRPLFNKENICFNAGTINTDGNTSGEYFLKK